MSDPISDDQLSKIGERLAGTFPDLLPVHPITVLGEGFRSIAVELASGALFRIGKTEEAAEGYLLEMRALPLMRQSVTVAVPDPRWYIAPGDLLANGALGYPKLPGTHPAWGEAPDPAFSDDLARFLTELHAVPLREAREVGVPTVDSRSRLLGAREVTTPVLAQRLSARDLNRVDQWWADFENDERMQSDKLVVCHHDLWHENLLIDGKGRLSAVLDWAHVGVGDPAHDFGALQYFGDAFVDGVIDAYKGFGGRFTEEEQHRVARFTEGREFGGIAWAIEHDDEQEIKDGIRKLLGGPLFEGQGIYRSQSWVESDQDTIG